MRNKLVLAYVPLDSNDLVPVLDKSWFLRRKESDMAAEALHSLVRMQARIRMCAICVASAFADRCH
jgi:hypothetical protein